MIKSLLVFFSFFIFFSCEEGGIEKKGFNSWLLSIKERDLVPSANFKNQVKLSDSLFVSQQNNEKVESFNYSEKGIQLFGNSEIGVGFFKKSTRRI